MVIPYGYKKMVMWRTVINALDGVRLDDVVTTSLALLKGYNGETIVG